MTRRSFDKYLVKLIGWEKGLLFLLPYTPPFLSGENMGTHSFKERVPKGLTKEFYGGKE
jgi:hypothetical protein